MTVLDKIADFQPTLSGSQATSPVRELAHDPLPYPLFPTREKHTMKKPGTYITTFHYLPLHHLKEISITAGEQNPAKTNKQTNKLLLILVKLNKMCF